MSKRKSKHVGSSLTSLFDEMGITEEVNALTYKKMIAAQIQATMKKRRITQVELAKKMKTSRTVVNRLLDPSDAGVTLSTLTKVSKALGLGLRLSLVT